MNKGILLLLLALIPLSTLHAAVYEASGLHNAVSRSETVQELFLSRWDEIIQREQYLDVYSRINWIPGFKIRTFNRGTGTKETVDMTLVRTYGSLSICIPVIGGYEKGEFTRRLSRADSNYKNSPKDTASTTSATETTDGDKGLLDKRRLTLGFTATGFHYGLTRKTEVDRGDAGSEEVTDYRFTQFFDDIFALSVLYMPYLYIHAGLIMNNQIEPDADGTMDYSNGSEGYPKYRFFFASNFLSIFNVNVTTSQSNIETIGTTVLINPAINAFAKTGKYFPQLTLGYSRMNLYNDEGYDAVWVQSATTASGADKTSEMSSADKSHARLHTASLDAKETIRNTWIFEAYSELQYCSKTLIEKRTERKLDLQPLREMHLSAGINWIGAFSKTRPDVLITSFSWGYFWDPAIAVQREKGYGYAAKGYMLSVKYDHPFIGGEIRFGKNYSTEIRQLVESVDKYVIEASLFGRF